MNELNVIKMPFYEWHLPEDLLAKVIEIAETTQYYQNDQNYGSHENLTYEPMIEYINSCLHELKTLKFPNAPNVEIVTTECWINKTPFMSKHHRHFHVNSIYSGVIYLTEHGNTGATRFFYNDIYKFFEPDFFSLSDQTIPHSEKNHFDVFPKKGQMIIFPSNVIHETTANNSKQLRYTISFNSFFKGTLGYSKHRSLLKV